jgi:hypothetical protein
MSEQNVEVLAGHSLLLAAPAFVPALILVVVIIVIAVRDRRRGDDDIDDEPSNVDTDRGDGRYDSEGTPPG